MQRAAATPSRLLAGARAGAVVGVLCVLSIAAGCRVPEPRARNLVMICLDTVRFDVFHGVGQYAPDTFDRWSQRARRFDRVQSTAPWTLPSVASALTGLYPNRHGAGALPNSTLDLARWVPSQLRDDVRTLPEILSERGYATVGLVAHGWFQQKFGLGRGFARLEYLKDREILREASLFLRERSQEESASPFFLYLHMMAAHDYVRIEKMNVEMPPEIHAAATAMAPAGICEAPDAEICRRFTAYVFAVSGLRESVARVLEALAREGLTDDTVVVLFSDHGEEFHDHVLAQQDQPIHPNGTRGEGHGHAMYQELLHVPVLVWGPGVVAEPFVGEASLVDLAPSMLHALGLDPPETMVGSSLDWGVGSDTAARGEGNFSSAIAYGQAQTAIVRDGWKRVIRKRPDDRLLFDLEKDPHEREPIRDASRERELDALLADYLADEERFLDALQVPGLTSDEVQALLELGYLTDFEPSAADAQPLSAVPVPPSQDHDSESVRD